MLSATPGSGLRFRAGYNIPSTSAILAVLHANSTLRLCEFAAKSFALRGNPVAKPADLRMSVEFWHCIVFAFQFLFGKDRVYL